MMIGFQITLEYSTVLEIIDLFISEVIQLMVRKTSRYAQQNLEANTVTRTSRLTKWHDICTSEIKEFLGFCSGWD